jgi:hypothetical protein
MVEPPGDGSELHSILLAGGAYNASGPIGSTLGMKVVGQSVRGRENIFTYSSLRRQRPKVLTQLT